MMNSPNFPNRRQALALLAVAVLPLPLGAEETAAALTQEGLDGLSAAPEITGGPLPAKGFRSKPPLPAAEVSRRYEALAGKGMRVVVKLDDGSEKICPCAEIPILFEKSKSTLAPDKQTLVNLDLLAKHLLKHGSAAFAVEGHASAEGDVVFNQKLSGARASTVFSELLKRGVSAAALPKTVGQGTKYARHKANAAERLLREDRRVLVVREG